MERRGRGGGGRWGPVIFFALVRTARGRTKTKLQSNKSKPITTMIVMTSLYE